MKTLLLDKEYKPISFIGFRKLIKLVFTDKVDILSVWRGASFYGNSEYPAIILLKKYTRRKALKPKFNFTGVFKRDLYTCQYTGQLLHPSKLNIDHVIPKALGGKSCYENCVVSSKEINAFKGNKTVEEAGLKLLKAPKLPTDLMGHEFLLMEVIHEDWQDYFPNVKRMSESDRLKIARR